MTRKVIYIQYTDPGDYPPIGHSAEILGENGWDVLLLGLGEGTSSRFDFEEQASIRIKRMKRCKNRFFVKGHYFVFVFWTVFETIIYRPQWVYASDHWACLPAILLKFLGCKLIYHEHDSPPEMETVNGFSLVMRMVAQMRVCIGRTAELAILPNQDRVSQFKESCNRLKPTFCVWNCPREKEIIGLQHHKKKSGELILYYHGNLSEELLPMIFLDVIKKNQGKVRLVAVGFCTEGSLGYREAFIRRAELLNVRDSITLHGAVSRQALWKFMIDADVGVAVMPKLGNINMRTMLGASNKVFDYMAMGIPVLVSDLSDWHEVFVKGGYGLSCNPSDVESINRTVEWMLKHSDQLGEMGAKAKERVITEWNYEKQFYPVISALEKKAL